MQTLKRIISALRDFFGWDVPSEERLSPAHGWLLPVPADLRALRVHGEMRPAGSREDKATRG